MNGLVCSYVDRNSSGSFAMLAAMRVIDEEWRRFLLRLLAEELGAGGQPANPRRSPAVLGSRWYRIDNTKCASGGRRPSGQEPRLRLQPFADDTGLAFGNSSAS
jgi:hypothetical protein